MSNENKVDELKNRLNLFMEAIETMVPEEVNVDDVDRLLAMLDELEQQLK